ncbi:MAG: hypothetical protein KA149_09430 [Chitinophagales bacterium]|jgi:hypothetical protein|nr:hypothetical protein [Chitinophagales bacterium]
MKKLLSISILCALLSVGYNAKAQTPGTIQPGTPNSTPQNPNLNPQNPNTTPTNPNYIPNNGGATGYTGPLGSTGPTGYTGSTGIYPPNSGPSGEMNDQRNRNLNYNQPKGFTGPTGPSGKRK